MLREEDPEVHPGQPASRELAAVEFVACMLTTTLVRGENGITAHHRVRSHEYGEKSRDC